MQKLWSKLNISSILKYGTAAILLVVPLYPKFPIFNIPGTYVAIRAEDFLVSVLSIIWFVYFLKSNKREFFKDKLNIAIFLFIWVGLLSILSAFFITKTAPVPIGLLHWARRIEYILPMFITLAAVKTGTNPRFLLICLFISAFLAFIYGFGQMHFSWPVISTQNEEYAKGIALRWIPGARLPSTFSGHYDLAAFLLMVLPISTTFFFTLRKKLSRFILFILLVVPSFWLLLQTEARVSFIAYLLAVSLSLVVIHKKVFILPFIVLSFVGMFTLSDLGERYIRTFNIYGQKIQLLNNHNLFNPSTVYAAEDAVAVTEDRSTSIRLNVEWPRALRAFAKNPLLGTGYSSISLATDNDYLRLLGEVGILGFLTFFLVMSRISGKLKDHLINSGLLDLNKAIIGGFAGSMFGILLNATFIDVFEASKVAIIFWTLVGLALSQVKNEVKI
ncbi:MAG: Uncharacterized protein G01um10145_162 [Microgenomates group bacterium Gr01-1014_5]|nr:MAG: Uncharacterized protein G01um10145_162 [Microgenomates group bacterium Gr01-1014_5]